MLIKGKGEKKRQIKHTIFTVNSSGVTAYESFSRALYNDQKKLKQFNHNAATVIAIEKAVSSRHSKKKI